MMVNEHVLVFIYADTFFCVKAQQLQKKRTVCVCFFFLDRPCTSRSFEYFQFQVQA